MLTCFLLVTFGSSEEKGSKCSGSASPAGFGRIAAADTEVHQRNLLLHVLYGWAVGKSNATTATITMNVRNRGMGSAFLRNM